MKYLFLVICLVLASSAVADGPSYSSMMKWVGSASSPNLSAPWIPQTDALTYYTDESTFDTANPGLTFEDFSSTLVPPNGVLSDTGPLDYYCNNSLFALHTILDGISIDEQAGGLMVVLTPPFIGVTSVTVGPNSFADDGLINFTLPTRAFGVFIVTPNGAATVNIEVFGAGGSLGTTSTTGGTGTGTFWGVFCDSEEITSIAFNDPGDGGELFANARFGLPTALSRSTWADIKASF